MALDATIGGCAMIITLMVVAQKGWQQIESMLREDPPDVADLGPAVFAMLGVAVALPFLFALQIARGGATPGKAAMSLSVRNVSDGAFPRYPRALGREVLRFCCIAPIVLLAPVALVSAVIVFLVILDMSRSRLSQTWYDRLTRTIIVAPVRERE
jgi:uncharacterized RDD family membrane protein YckC